MKNQIIAHLDRLPNGGWKLARKTSSGAADHEAEVKALHAKIGQLTVENDFLSRAFGR